MVATLGFEESRNGRNISSNQILTSSDGNKEGIENEGGKKSRGRMIKEWQKRRVQLLVTEIHTPTLPNGYCVKKPSVDKRE